MKILKLISRLFVGAIFIFSGFVKAVDPLGSTYKFVDYFRAFGMEWAEPVAFFLAVLMSSAEFTIGIALFFNLKMKISTWGALLFMSFFLPLTFILALYNPVTDCGCFGDALILSNWETFWKNVIIIIPVIFIFWKRKTFVSMFSCKIQWLIAVIFFMAASGFSYYCYEHLPLIDFRPFKVGTYIPDKMTYPEGAEPDVYENIFHYKNLKTGEVKEFNQSNYPWQDTLNWAWVDTKSILVKEGYHPPIHDFVIESVEDGDITDMILENNVFLMIAYDISKASTENIDKFKAVRDYCNNAGYDFYCVTSSGEPEIENFKAKTGADFHYCNADEIMLKTVIRANPGLVLIKKGTVKGKWHYNDIPSVDELKNLKLIE